MRFFRRRPIAEPERPTEINGYPVRHRGEACPGCGALADRWCASDCGYLDLMDYR